MERKPADLASGSHDDRMPSFCAARKGPLDWIALIFKTPATMDPADCSIPSKGIAFRLPCGTSQPSETRKM